MSSVSSNYNFMFLPQTEAKLDDFAANSFLNDKNIRKKDLQHQQDNQDKYGPERQALQSILHTLNEKIIDFENNHPSTAEKNHLDQFLTESNQLQEQLQNASETKLLHSTLVNDIQNWRLSAIHELARAQSSEDIESSFNKQAQLINQAVSLVHNVNEQAQTKLPLGETLSSTRSASLSLGNNEDNDFDHHNYDSNLASQDNSTMATNSTSQDEPQPTPDPSNINLYIIMLSLVVSSNTIVNNAISMQTKMDKYLQQMVTDLQNLLGLATLVNKAYKDAQAQAVDDDKDDNNELNFGWTSKSKNGHGIDMAALLNERNKNQDPQDQWLVKDSPDDLSKIALGFYDSSKGGTPNPLLEIYGEKDGDNYFMSLNGPDGKSGLNGMLKTIGANLSNFIGGDIASQNVNAFDSSTTLEGVTKSITSAIDNLQSQSGANVSKLNLANQGLNSAVSNFVTLMSNLLSVMMKLAAI